MNKKYLNIYTLHFGKILSNYSILGICFMSLIMLSTVLTALYYVFSFVIVVSTIIFTVGTIFVIKPNFIGDMFAGGDTMVNITKALNKAFPYVLGFTLAFAITALVLLCVQKEKKSTAKIVVSSVIIGLAVVLSLVFFLGGYYSAWKQ